MKRFFLGGGVQGGGTKRRGTKLTEAILCLIVLTLLDQVSPTPVKMLLANDKADSDHNV